MYMEVSVESLNLPIRLHLLADINRITRLSLLAQVFASQNLGIFHVAHASEVIDNPFVKLVAPVGEEMGHIGVCFARSVDVLEGIYRVSKVSVNLLSQIKPRVLIRQDVPITVTFHV